MHSFKSDKENILKVFKDWHATERIGEGGYGRVYRAEKYFGGTVETSAIKIISLTCADFSEYETNRIGQSLISEKLSAFENEIQNMARLSGHPNVVAMNDYGKLGDEFFIRMPLLTPLDTYIENRKLTAKDVIKVGADICNALEACEKEGIIHRDVKESNIFVANDGHTFVLGDFGIAKSFEYDNRPKTSIGTDGYMAPEVRDGHYDNRADIYSLGVVLEILCQKLKRTPKRLKKIIEKATKRSQNDRYQTAAAMKKDLIKSQGSRGKKRSLLLLAALVSIISFLLSFFYFYPSETQPENSAPVNDYVSADTQNDYSVPESSKDYSEDFEALQYAIKMIEYCNYTDALRRLSKIPVESPYYEDAVAKAQIAFDNSIESRKVNIMNCVQMGFYEDAFETIDFYYKDVPEGVDTLKLDIIKTQVQNMNFEYLKPKVLEYTEENDYSSALNKINDTLKYDSSQKIKDLKASVEAEYETYLINEVNDSIARGDTLHASSLLTEALSLIPDSAVLSELYQKIN